MSRKINDGTLLELRAIVAWLERETSLI